jgi:hypothetical protein
VATIPKAIVRGPGPRYQATGAPSPDGVTVVPTYALHAPDHIAIATLVGGPIAGGWLLAHNYFRLGQARAAWTLIAVALTATAMMVLIGTLWGVRLAMLVSAVMMLVARVLQREVFLDHRALGGPSSSGWTALALIVVAVAVAGFGIRVTAFFVPDVTLHL